MRFKATAKVLGMKWAKGQLDNGTEYDFTRVYVEQSLDASKGSAVGFGVELYEIGTSTAAELYKKLPFPHEAEFEFELVTTGKASKTLVHSYKPLVSTAKPAPAQPAPDRG